MRQNFNFHFIASLFISVAGFALASPKWNIPISAWIAPGALLFLISDRPFWRSVLLVFSVLFISGLIANYRVMPFPVVFLMALCLQIALVNSIPYVVATFLARRLDGWMATLVFPSIAVFVEFLASFGGAGVWGSIANTQASNLYLMQSAAFFGVWGISFLIYWWAGLSVWIFRKRSWSDGTAPIVVYLVVFIGFILIGVLRLSTSSENLKSVKVAGISAMNLHALFQIYQDAFGKTLKIDATTLTQTSAELQELNKGLAVFIEDPSDEKFARTFSALSAFQDSLFAEAALQARAGAKIISFSEALLFTIKPREWEVIEKGRRFAKENKVRLFLALGTFIPGKIEFGKKYIENKVITINESGEIENVFFKNRPVPLVEGSVPGDGEIPVLQTSFGKIAISICYDADHPGLMRKAGEQKADLMILPSGDWPEISPYHAQMATIRAIENGFSLLRPASNATSIACDAYGRIVASMEFLKKGITSCAVEIPLNGTRTLYTRVGDVVPFASGLFAFGLIIKVLFFRSRQKVQSSCEVSAGGDDAGKAASTS